VADDTKDGNLTQTVLTFSDTYLQMPEGAETVRRLMQVWDEGAKLIDEDPNAYRALLVEKARLPKPLETTYKVNTYPAHQLPSEQDVDGVLTWMKEKKLLTSNITYDQIVWKPANQ
jgi:NitT/TauT family transport system substrate-binding protein